MSAVIESISALADGVIAIVEYLGKRLLEGIKLIAYMLEAVSDVERYLTWVPATLAGIIGTIVLIAVLYRILGWGD